MFPQSSFTPDLSCKIQLFFSAGDFLGLLAFVSPDGSYPELMLLLVYHFPERADIL